MADALAQLLAQQQGIAYTPRENIYGQIGGTIASALPQIVSPYASTGSNIATVLGGSLLAGLLGYQAKQEAAEKNQALIPAITGIMGATDVAGVNTQLGTFDPEVATRLAPIALQRMSALQEREQKIADQIAEEERALRRLEEQQRLKTEGAKELEETKRINRESLAKLEASIKQQKENGTYEFPSLLGDMPAEQQNFIGKMTALTNTMVDFTKELAPLTKGEFATENLAAIVKNDKNIAAKYKTLATQVTQAYSGAAMRKDEYDKFLEFLKGTETDITPSKAIEFMKDAVKRYRIDSADRIGIHTIGDKRNTPLKEIARRLRNTPYDKLITFDYDVDAATTPTVATSATQAGNATPTAEQLAQAKSILNDPNESEEYKNEIRQMFGL